MKKTEKAGLLFIWRVHGDGACDSLDNQVYDKQNILKSSYVTETGASIFWYGIKSSRLICEKSQKGFRIKKMRSVYVELQLFHDLLIPLEQLDCIPAQEAVIDLALDGLLPVTVSAQP